MTFPGARILSFDDPLLPSVPLEQTSHYRLTRDILNAPAMYWQHRRGKGGA